MAGEGAGALAEAGGEGFDEEYRTMPPAGTADGHGQVAAVVAFECRQPVANEATDVFEHAHGVGCRAQECGNRCVAAGQRAQLRLVVRVGQAAHVEYEIRVERNAVLEAEGFEQQRQPGDRRRGEILDPGAKRVGGEIAGVDVMRHVRNAGDQLLLAGNTLRQGQSGD